MTKTAPPVRHTDTHGGKRRVRSEQHVQLVVTCSHRKTTPPRPELQARCLTGPTVGDRLSVWIDRIRTTEGRRRAAADLYAGEHWTVAKSLPGGTPDAWNAGGWVVSAGYGLVRFEAQLASYGAAFATGKADSVVRSEDALPVAQQRKQWWRGLTEWEGPEKEAVRSLSGLGQAHPEAPILIACSGTYLAAIEDDLRQLVQRNDRVFVASTGIRASRDRPWITGGDGRLRSVLGGSMMALNVRVLGKLLESANEHGFERIAVNEYLEALCSQGERRSYDRLPMSDSQVRRFVNQAIGQARVMGHSLPTKSSLLRKFRDEGHACEQKRFGRLFDSVWAETGLNAGSNGLTDA